MVMVRMAFLYELDVHHQATNRVIHMHMTLLNANDAIVVQSVIGSHHD